MATINVMEEEGIVEQSARTGAELLGPGLRALAEKHPSVGEVRGLGTFWALELVRDRQTREPLVPYNASGADNAPMAEFAAACKKGGLWPLTMRQPHHIAPPCNIGPQDVAKGLAILDEALSVADTHTV